jgi:hypothetical protein
MEHDDKALPIDIRTLGKLHEFGQIEENLQNLWGDVRRSKRLFN